MVGFDDQAARLRHVGEGDTLADGRSQQGRIVIRKRLGRLTGDDGAGAAAVEDEAGDQLRAIDARLVQKRQHLG